MPARMLRLLALLQMRREWSGTELADRLRVNVRTVRRDIDRPTMLNGQVVGPPPAGYTLIPGVLHAYKASAKDLAGYVPPGTERRDHRDDDSECDRDDHGDHGSH